MSKKNIEAEHLFAKLAKGDDLIDALTIIPANRFHFKFALERADIQTLKTLSNSFRIRPVGNLTKKKLIDKQIKKLLKV